MPIESNLLQTSQDRNIIIITLIQRDLSDNRNEIELSWTNEIFNYITESLKEIKAINKIIIDVSQKDIIRIWSVIKKEDKAISNQIYQKEIAILEYLANFAYDIDFHIITEDKVSDVVDKNSKIMFDSK